MLDGKRTNKSVYDKQTHFNIQRQYMLETCMPEFVLSQSKETKTDMDVFAPTGGGQFSKWFEISLPRILT